MLHVCDSRCLDMYVHHCLAEQTDVRKGQEDRRRDRPEKNKTGLGEKQEKPESEMES